MTKQVLLDTNILIYAVDEDSRFFGLVHELLNDDSLEFFTTSKNLSEFLSVVTRTPHPSMSIQDALVVIDEFRQNFKILYPTENSFAIFIDMLRKYSPHGLKIHDHEIASIALSNKVKDVATLNRKDFLGIEEINLLPIS